MLLDLIILIIRLATKNSDAKNSSAPTKRKVPAGQVTLECPFCHTLGLATQFNLEHRTSAGWQRDMEVYECAHCRRSMNADALRNDGTGVLIAKTWDCPSCQTPNPATQIDCASCGARLQ